MFDQEYTDNIFKGIVDQYRVNDTKFPMLTKASIALGSLTLITMNAASKAFGYNKETLDYQDIDVIARSKIGAVVACTTLAVVSLPVLAPLFVEGITAANDNMSADTSPFGRFFI